MLELNQVYQGDCLELMKLIPDGNIDMVLTDPPYGMDFQSNRRNEKHMKIENDRCLDWINDWCDEMYRIMKNNTHGYAFCSFHNVDKFKIAIESRFTLNNILIWEKNNRSMGDLTGDYAPKYEMIIFFHKGRRKLLGGFRFPNIFQFSRTRNENHPTEKPVDLLEFLIKNSSLEGEVVLDMFGGSGTTGLAAKNLNRNFILIEKEEKYVEIARKRLSNKK